MLALFAPIGWGFALGSVVVGGLTHVALNLVLDAARLRKAPL